MPEMSLLKEEKQLFLKEISGIEEAQISEILENEFIDSLQIGFPQCVEFMKEYGAFNYENITRTPIRMERLWCLIMRQMHYMGW